jgi:hypothetical protein
MVWANAGKYIGWVMLWGNAMLELAPHLPLILRARSAAAGFVSQILEMRICPWADMDLS